MKYSEFIDNKAPQLGQFGKAFLNNQLDFNEIQLYLWDTLEEWQQLNPQGDAQSDIEKVFWHLIHAFDKWPDWTIRGNQFLRQQITDCCDFLTLEGPCPTGCHGNRPITIS
jgi:hypothetical protein